MHVLKDHFRMIIVYGEFHSTSGDDNLSLQSNNACISFLFVEPHTSPHIEQGSAHLPACRVMFYTHDACAEMITYILTIYCNIVTPPSSNV